MRSRRREVSPIWRDVKFGTPSGVAGGRFVTNDGESLPEDNYLLISDGGEVLLETDDGSGILIS